MHWKVLPLMAKTRQLLMQLTVPSPACVHALEGFAPDGKNPSTADAVNGSFPRKSPLFSQKRLDSPAEKALESVDSRERSRIKRLSDRRHRRNRCASALGLPFCIPLGQTSLIPF